MVTSLLTNKIQQVNKTGLELLKNYLVFFGLLPVLLLWQTEHVPDQILSSAVDMTTNKQPKMPDWDFKKKKEI